MKRKESFFVAYMFCTTMFFASCVSNKKIVYLQGTSDSYAVPREIAQAFELKVQPDDQLAISVSSRDARLVEKFNNTTLIGGANNSTTGTNNINVSSGVAYFQVDKDGNIAFPLYGSIHVGGLTTRQISDMLQERFRAQDIRDAVVNTKVMSFKVTVMGDVKNPGTQTYQGERLTVLEAIGRAGDLNNSAKRDHVLVVREEDGRRMAYEMDLRDHNSVFQSPAYYLQQNDVVYVQPNKSQRVKGSTGYTWLTVGSTLGSMVVSVVSLIVALKKW